MMSDIESDGIRFGLTLLCSKNLLIVLFGISLIFLPTYYAHFMLLLVCIMLTFYIYNYAFLHKNGHNRNKVRITRATAI